VVKTENSALVQELNKTDATYVCVCICIYIYIYIYIYISTYTSVQFATPLHNEVNRVQPQLYALHA
jgi:hypothetical protein